MTMNHVRDTYLCTYGGGVRDMYVLYGGGERYIVSLWIVECLIRQQAIARFANLFLFKIP